MAQSWGNGAPPKNGPMARWRSSFRGLDYGMAGAVNGTQKAHTKMLRFMMENPQHVVTHRF